LAAAFFATACASDLGSGVGVEQKLPTSDPIAPVTYDALYVVNGGDSSLSVVNTETNEVSATIRFHDVSWPHHVYLSADRSRMLVAAPGADLSGGHSSHDHGSGGGAQGAVLMLESATGRMIVARRTDAMNHNAVYSPNGSEVWTTQYDGRALILDPHTLATRSTVDVGLNPSEVTFSAEGDAFVANTGSNDITVIDPATKAVVKQIGVGGTPVGAWQASNGLAYVDNETDATISAIDTRSLEVIGTYPLGFVPGMVAFGPDGNVWVADPNNAQVVLREPRGTGTIAKIKTGNGAHAIGFSGDGKWAYVSNQMENTVSVIDVAQRTTVKTLAVGVKPNGMVWRAK
jgi:YVTN family beta-propeller protein